MSGRVVGWASAVGVGLGGAQALAINKVDAGKGWQVAAVVCTVTCAVLAGWLASKTQQQPASSGQRQRHGAVLGPGSIYIGGKVGGSVRTRVSGVSPVPASTDEATDGDVLEAGAVRVEQTGEVGKHVSTQVTGPAKDTSSRP